MSNNKPNATIHVSFEKFINMTQLQFNCQHRMFNEINRKVDILANNLDSDPNSFTSARQKIININIKMQEIHNECTKSFSILEKS